MLRRSFITLGAFFVGFTGMGQRKKSEAQPKEEIRKPFCPLCLRWWCIVECSGEWLVGCSHAGCNHCAYLCKTGISSDVPVGEADRWVKDNYWKIINTVKRAHTEETECQRRRHMGETLLLTVR